VRGLDANGDGVNDTYIAYDEDGRIHAIGRVGKDGEMEVVYEQAGIFDQILESLGLADLEPPEEALFSSFDDPYIVNTYGAGEAVPDELPASDIADIVEVSPPTDGEEEDADDPAAPADEE
jgi:hypothetical protein